MANLHIKDGEMPFNLMMTQTVERRVLEFLRINVSYNISGHQLHVDMTEHIGDSMAFHLQAKLAAHKMHEDLRAEDVPLTWWDHLKQALGWRWLGPVRTRVIKTQYVLWLVCPHVEVPPGAQQIHYQFLGGRR